MLFIVFLFLSSYSAFPSCILLLNINILDMLYALDDQVPLIFKKNTEEASDQPAHKDIHTACDRSIHLFWQIHMQLINTHSHRPSVKSIFRF